MKALSDGLEYSNIGLLAHDSIKVTHKTDCDASVLWVPVKHFPQDLVFLECKGDFSLYVRIMIIQVLIYNPIAFLRLVGYVAFSCKVACDLAVESLV